jgi:hypothetical protein
MSRELDRRSSIIKDQALKIEMLSQNCNSLMQSNSKLTQQTLEMKQQLEKINKLDVSAITREVEASRSKAHQLELENQKLKTVLLNQSGSVSEVTVRQLEEDNLRLQKLVQNLTDKLNQGQYSVQASPRTENMKADDTMLVSPSRPLATVKKRMGDEIDELLLSEKVAMGEVSYEEMLKLELRIKEFGDYNIELEELIYKLKAKIAGRDYASISAYNSGASDRRFSSKESERLQKIIADLTVQVDRLSQVSPGKNAITLAAPELFEQIESLVTRNKVGEEAGLRLLQLQKGYHQLSDELAELKDRHKQLEIKHNTLVSVNIQNEAHIERLIAQIQDNKEYFKKLIGENEALKLKEKEAAQEIANYFRQNSELHDSHNNSLREKASLQQDYDALHAQLEAYQQDLANLRADIDAFTK